MALEILHDLALLCCHRRMFSVSKLWSLIVLISSGEHTVCLYFRTSALVTCPLRLQSFPLGLPSHGQLLILHVFTFSKMPCLTALSENRITHSPRCSGAGLYCGHLFPTPSHVGSLHSATVGVFTPKKLINTTNEGFSPWKNQFLNIYRHTTTYFYSSTVTVQHMAFLIFFIASVTLKSSFLCAFFKLSLSSRYNLKRAKTLSILFIAMSRSMCTRILKFFIGRMNSFHVLSSFYVPHVFKILNFLTEVFHS